MCSSAEKIPCLRWAKRRATASTCSHTVNRTIRAQSPVHGHPALPAPVRQSYVGCSVQPQQRESARALLHAERRGDCQDGKPLRVQGLGTRRRSPRGASLAAGIHPALLG